MSDEVKKEDVSDLISKSLFEIGGIDQTEEVRLKIEEKKRRQGKDSFIRPLGCVPQRYPDKGRDVAKVRFCIFLVRGRRIQKRRGCTAWNNPCGN